MIYGRSSFLFPKRSIFSFCFVLFFSTCGAAAAGVVAAALGLRRQGHAHSSAALIADGPRRQWTKWRDADRLIYSSAIGGQ